ncbi:PepSY-like domain-containing protein [Brachyspira alvinipulli]|uniref:PepSY-like domain-containing protein n=1 Tax=Brachyspira alvinipulli TaxID=84379 RepID=UPI000483285C|nr:PepSY-like domain-containing protein [Brachyspira alvinipulli]
MFKNIILLIIIYITSASFIGFDNEGGIEFIPYSYLPDNVQEFVNTYFKEYKVYNAAIVSSSYVVIFKGGSSIHFKRNGEWQTIIGNRQIIPINIASKFIDSNIMNIVKERYTSINNIYKRRKGYEFKVDDKEYIYISYDGNIIKIKKSLK